ncbi:DNA topoisomerase (ATP-hydrolyzing) subunit A [Agrococcus sp. TF02-05]|uniref:DNA gyrase/topoisomerase IV subunit A n=1 Tax=Agrococcus sp. TF02-05 TaxID=2815211 RepID=UPI001AA134DC|nr:DNA topoisomerase IV subunit A [Agrococcus sp. TF02-05]MBO1768892.1 DNA topoisomerase IV subunit A [Agrococcus sp. TF02-05]
MTATPPPDPSAAIAERIDDVDVASEMQDSFLEYAYSVIYARALPDARDGLKPVQRRILFQMSEMGLRPEKGHVKSARVVGDVMGKLHPHGDTAIYDALVRLAQPFSLRLPLVDGHGNFGSLDDGPAAPRYTEARLAAAGLSLTEGLDEDVVDFVPNYDNSYQQPDVLPASYPNLLVNGASGIAVGMATNMAPHNLVEVVQAAKHLLAHPDASVADLMRHVPGPDLPGGGVIVGLDGVRDAYESGRGSFKTRARASIERHGRKTQIVITELPYLVGPERVIEKIKDGVQSKKLQGLTEVQDLTDRKHGLRLVISIKTGFDPEAVLQQLYRYTPLEDGFSINNVALVHGKPETLGLKQLLRVYLDHRVGVVRRRSEFRLRKKRERLHLVEGLLIAILDIDEVIQVIRTSDDSEQARSRLQSVFDLSEPQAEYILELRLRRLTKFSRIELEAERDELLAQIAELERILGSDAALHEVVAAELDEVAERFGTPRRTALTEGNGQPTTGRASAKAAVSLEIADAPTRVVMSATGRLVRVDGEEPIPVPARRSRHDAIRSTIATTTRGAFGLVTSTGAVLRLTPADLPSVPPASVGLTAGVKVRDLGAFERGEEAVALIDLASSEPWLVATAQGVVKRVKPAELRDRDRESVIALKAGDRVVGVAPAPDESWVVLVTSDAQLLRFPAAAINPQGPGAGGMKGIGLKADASVRFAGAVADGAEVVTVTEAAETLAGLDEPRVKVSSLEEFPAKGRGTGGVQAHRLLKGEVGLALAWAGPAPLAVGADGSQRQLPPGGAPRAGSGVAIDGAIGAIGARLGTPVD